MKPETLRVWRGGHEGIQRSLRVFELEDRQMSELDAALQELKSAPLTVATGLEDRVMRAIGKLRADRKLSRALLPFEAAIPGR